MQVILPEIRCWLHNMESDEKYLLFIFPVAFPLFWIFISIFLSRLGWSSYSSKYGVSKKTKGVTYPMRSGTFGLVNYRNCLNLTITDKGLYTSVLFPFRIGHKPFIVPWSDFSKIEIKKVLFFEYL